MRGFLHPPVEYAEEVLFPIFCLGCESEGEWLCTHCRPGIVIGGVFDPPEQETLGRMSAVTKYNAVLTRRLIQAWKYEYATGLTPVIASFLDTFFSAYKERFSRVDAIVPVPLHPRRFAERGFNQADIIARIVAAQLRKSVVPALARRIYTRKQALLPKEKRKESVSGAFVSKENVRECRILLVDDVYTTGETMHECARVLQTAGAASVDGFAFARG